MAFGRSFYIRAATECSGKNLYFLMIRHGFLGISHVFN
jgi:hypothetical protein